jgi:SAM-dependent methyltransferase
MPELNLDKTESKQKKYYNRIAETYDIHYSNKYALEYRHKVYDKILSGMDFKNLNVLDAMCGGGESTGYFLKKGANVKAVDISEKQCEIYSKRYPGVPVSCASITNTDFSKGEFDFIVTDSLHHLNPNLDEGIKEIHRILKTGGYFLAFEPSEGSVFDYLRKKWYKLDRTFFEDNEQSIDIDKLESKYNTIFNFKKNIYGGNLAYLLVQESMLFRIPSSLIKYYAPVLLPIDNFIQKFQGKRTACWILSLLQKK